MKLFKAIAIFFLTLGIFATTGCSSQSFCTEQDRANITEKVLEKVDAAFESGTKYTSNNGQSYGLEEWKTWYCSQNNITGEAEQALVTIETWNGQTSEKQSEFVKSIYNFENSACLTLEERLDENGALISPKTFNDALNLGLIEGLFVWPSAWLLIQFTNLFGGSGYAIIGALFATTFLVRGVVLALTWKSTQQSQRMSMVQDEMNKLNAKYGNPTDTATKNKKAQEMMDLYQKYDINPMKSMLVPFLTLPIFIAFYGAVRQTVMIRDGVVFGSELGLNLGEGVLAAFNGGSIFPIIVLVLMFGFQFLTMKLPKWMNKTTKKDPEYKQKELKKKAKETGAMKPEMMTYMMLIMIVFAGWVLPLALSIYWIASSLFSIFQTVLFRKLPQKNYDQKKVSFRS